MILRAAVVLPVLFVLSGCGNCNLAGKTEILAKVNGRCITVDMLSQKAAMYNIQINSAKEAKKFLNLVINNYLILEEAKKDGVKLGGEELAREIENFVPGYTPKEIKKVLKKGNVSYRAWKKDLVEKMLIKKEINFVMRNKIEIDENELKDYFWTNIIKFRRAHKVHVRQIVVDSKEKASEIKAMIDEGESFEDLAKKYSVGSEAKKGGDLGYFGKRDMPAFISNIVFEMKKGKVSRAVSSDYGWHIFKVEDIKLAETPGFEKVRDEVHEAFFEEKKNKYFNKWMKEIRKNAKIHR